ncbi:RagB/SusD family nutrient uptake outer membrane protein [Elizabethkingia anophelis]|uniref:RagB/SusD family nutrient uptake outer membrane protein n=1 Tax=Elizabethkingia anophelis TaxID=1117645 RepID=UPI00389192C1
MKNNKIFLSLAAILWLTSCNDILSELPDNRTVLDSPEKISEILVNAYPTRTYMDFTETMSDNTYDTEQTNVSREENTKAFKWETITTTGSDTPSDFWDNSYSAIAHANQALDAIQKSNNPAALTKQKGEALLARAYNHFMLLQVFSMAYNPSTADKTLGIPYVKEVESSLKKQYTRQSMKEVMDNIQHDLEEGLPLIKDDYKQPKYHFTKSAAKAFATRFYLVKGDFAKVVENADYLGARPTIIRNWKSFSALGIYEQMANYGSSSVSTNLLLSTEYSTYGGRKLGNDRFAFPSKMYTQIFGWSSNPTGQAWYYSTVSANRINDLVPKFNEYFKVTNPTAGIGYPMYNYTLLSNDEAYLNKLEALVMLNRIDEAVSGYNYFISTRTKAFDPATHNLDFVKIKNFYQAKITPDEIAPFYALTDNQKIMVKAILEVKKLEFYHEGLRWFDIKRMNMPVSHTILGETPMILKKDDPRRAVQIPQYVIAEGVQANPR